MGKLVSGSPRLTALFYHTRADHGLVLKGTAQNQIPHPENKLSYYFIFHNYQPQRKTVRVV